MATTVARLEAVLSAKDDDFRRSIDRSERRFDRLGGSIKTGAAVIGGALTAGLAVAAKAGFDEFMEGQKVAAQTGAVLKSTGGIANVTAKQIDSMAESMMRKTGIDDEAIKSSSNLLLTFTKIRNEVGAGNDIFNQAQQAVLDFSVTFEKDLGASAIMVGKALNDPVKGVTALGRAGVQFTESQRETIKSLVDSGRAMDAQKLILKELETQTKGSAEAAGKTFSGQLNILKETFMNTAGEIVGRFVPALVRVATFVAPLITKALDAVFSAIGRVADFFAQHQEVFVGFARVVIDSFRRLAKSAETEWPKIQAAAEPVGEWYEKHLKPTITKVLDDLREAWDKHGLQVGGIVEKQLGRVWSIVKPLMENLRLTIEAVLALIRGDWQQAWDSIKQIPVNAVRAAMNLVRALVGMVVDVGEFLGGKLKEAAVAGVTGIGNAVWNVVNNIGEFILGRVDAIRGWGANVGGWVKDAAINAVLGIGSGVWEIVNNIWEFISERVEAIKGWGSRVGGWIRDAIVDAMKGIGKEIWNKLMDDLRGWRPPGLPSVPPVKDWFKGDVGDVSGFAGAAGAVFGPSSVSQSLWDDLASAQRRFGLAFTSGYRPGAITKHGTRSDHGVFPSKAIDVAGPAASMAAFFRSLIGDRSIKQAFYDPLGSIFGGFLSGYREGGHSDHVHVATYDKGGWLPPGLTLALNKTGMAERVISPGSERPIIVNIGGLMDKQDATRWLQRLFRDAGQSGFIIDQPQPGF